MNISPRREKSHGERQEIFGSITFSVEKPFRNKNPYPELIPDASSLHKIILRQMVHSRRLVTFKAKTERDTTSSSTAFATANERKLILKSVS
jgi:hypothetical protein